MHLLKKLNSSKTAGHHSTFLKNPETLHFPKKKFLKIKKNK